MKPIIVYPGSKYDFYPAIRDRIPKDIRVFCEPFVGGGSTTLNLLEDMEYNIEKVVIGDLSPRVAAFWSSVVKDPIKLAKRYDELFEPFDAIISKLGTRREAYLEIEWFGQLPKDTPESTTDRYKFVQSVRQDLYRLHADLVKYEPEDELTMGAILALMHNISYSGVAFSGGLSYQRVIKTHLGVKKAPYVRASKLLNRANAEVVCGDYSSTCAKVLGEQDAFIYLDPPYVLQADKLYEKGVFNHQVLSEYLLDLPKDVKFLLSYDDSAYTRSLYRNQAGIYINEYKLARGYVAGSSGKDSSLNGEELFISNYLLEW